MSDTLFAKLLAAFQEYRTWELANRRRYWHFNMNRVIALGFILLLWAAFTGFT